MKQILIAVAFVMMSAMSFAQNKITGTIHSGDTKPFAGATVEVLKAADSSLVKLSVSGSNGQFNFENISNGKYLLGVSAVGHVKFYSASFELSPSHSTMNMDDVQLKIAENNLKEVKVTTKKPMIEQKIDRTVVNVEAAITNTGSSALEVLEKSPGVT